MLTGGLVYMLVCWLHKLYGYIPMFELVDFRLCLKGDGIWDILGYYDSKPHLVYICESEIEKCVDEIKFKIFNKAGSLNEKEVTVLSRLAVRTLVRLHEHCHALLHTCDFRGLIAPNHDWYISLKPEISEPLTEFIAFSIIQKSGCRFFQKIFEYIDDKAPKYYKKWTALRDLVKSKTGDSKTCYTFVPGIVKVARESSWENFNELKESIKDQWDDEVARVCIAYNIKF